MKTNTLLMLLLPSMILLSGCWGPKGEIYITESDQMDKAQALKETSIMKRHRVVVAFNGLKPGKSYEAAYKLLDAKGKAVLTDTFKFQPDEPGWFIWKWFEPDPLRHTPGRWKWVVEVKGVKTFTKRFSVSSPTKEEKETLAHQGTIRDEILRTFAKYWLAYGQNFYTIATEGGPNGRNLLIEVSGMDYRFHRLLVTEADSRNGIEGRLFCQFGFKVSRSCDGKSWTLWEDVTRSETVMDATFNETIKLFEGEKPGNYVGLHLAFYGVQFKGRIYVTADADSWKKSEIAGFPTLPSELPFLPTDHYRPSRSFSMHVLPSADFVRAQLEGKFDTRMPPLSSEQSGKAIAHTVNTLGIN